MQYLAGKQKIVTRPQGLGEILLDLAEHRAAAPGHAAALAHIAHIELRHLDDGADIEAVLLGDARMGDAPQPFFRAADAGVAFVAAQRIAAGGDEIDDAVEGFALQLGIGCCGTDLGIKPIGVEGGGAGRAQHVLRQNVQRAGKQRRRVLRAEIVGVECCAAFQHFEAVGRDEDRLGGLVHAVVGAADALGKAARALRRADMHDEVDIAPVDAEVERRGGDDGAQRVVGHGLFDAAALADFQRTVMQGDRQRILIGPPQFLEQKLGLAARVDEQQRHFVAADRLVDLGNGIARRMAGPRHALAGVEDGDVGLGAAADGDEAGHGGARGAGRDRG